jgi:hypothetical protein
MKRQRIDSIQRNKISDELKNESCENRNVDIILKNLFRIPYSRGYQVVEDPVYMIRFDFSLILVNEVQLSLTVFRFAEQEEEIDLHSVLRFHKNFLYSNYQIVSQELNFSIYVPFEIAIFFERLDKSYVSTRSEVSNIIEKSILISLNEFPSCSDHMTRLTHKERKCYFNTGILYPLSSIVMGESIVNTESIQICLNHDVFESLNVQFTISEDVCFLCYFLCKRSLPFHQVLYEDKITKISISSISQIAEVQYYFENIIEYPTKIIFDLANVLLYK